MLNRSSLDAVAAARIDDDLGRPLYGSYCFAGLPSLVTSQLTADTSPGMPADVLPSPRRYDRVVVILLDGFGWSFWERLGQSLPFFRRPLDDGDGVVSKLTTQFPSTTAAHVTTLHTGAAVGQSGVFEWFYYEPLLGQIFAPLLHATIEHDGLERFPPTRTPLFPTHTLYQALGQQGVGSVCMQHRRYAYSPYSKAVTQGATMVPYGTLPEALANLGQAAAAEDGPGYLCLYVDTIDGISHHYGPESPQLEAEILGVGQLLESILHPALAELPGQTLVLLTADHGHTAIDPERTIYLDQALPGCDRWMRRGADDQPLVPGGSSRDMFLYLKPEHVDEAAEQLGALLENEARVMRIENMLAQGYFGPDPSARLRERLGDLVVLPRRGKTVWWNGGGRFTEHKLGHHGGLSAEEMEIPLLAWSYGG